MIVRKCNSWRVYLERIEGYLSKPAPHRERFIFRGQADANWSLQTTLDRFAQSLGEPDRDVVSALLLDAFVKEGLGILPRGVDRTLRSKDKQESERGGLPLEFLARHHGLPTAIMDWTRSPYIAAYFAFADMVHQSRAAPTHVAVWAMDLGAEDELDGRNAAIFSELVELVRDREELLLLADNPRAIEQRAVCVRVLASSPRIEEILGHQIRRFEIPATERKVALVHLDEMGINQRSLFRTLDAAASTARWRVDQKREGVA